MSSDATRYESHPEPATDPRFGEKTPAKEQRPAVENADITQLKIEESAGVDCDPYNSTGQFLAAEIRRRARD